MTSSDVSALLVVIEGHIPTTRIIIKTLKRLSCFSEIKVVTPRTFKYKEFFSGKYKILFIRTCRPEWEILIRVIKNNKTKFVYYIDDNFWELKGNTPIAKCYQNKKVLDTLNSFITIADKVVAGSENLAEYIRKHYNPLAVSIPAAFDFSILERHTQSPKTPPIKVLYSATLYRENDFQYVIGALIKLSHEYQNKITIHFHGYVPGEMKQLPNVVYDETFYPYDNYIAQKHVASYDIGLAPLADSIFNQAKSNVKYREYGACNIAGVYSDITPYQQCVTHTKNGLLVKSDEESWYKAIKSLIDNRQLRETIAANAYADVRENYSHEKIAPQWQAIFSNLEISKNDGYFIKYQVLHIFYRVFIGISQLYIRIKNYYVHHGLKVTFKKICTSLRDFFKPSPDF